VPFEPWHLEWLNLQASQMMLSQSLTQQYGASLKSTGPCYSAFAGSEVIACAGVVEFWPGRAQVWSLLSDKLPLYQKSIHKAVKQFLKGYRCRRLECVVDPYSEPAFAWAKRLGFQFESYMERYTPDGKMQAMMTRLE
jgi:hypothetical protein